jgi:hypothetical protein
MKVPKTDFSQNKTKLKKKNLLFQTKPILEIILTNFQRKANLKTTYISDLNNFSKQNKTNYRNDFLIIFQSKKIIEIIVL